MQQTQQKIKVLVVDDEYAITQNLKYAFEKNGFIAYTALNGDDGLALFRKERPAVVILDIKMPGINGLDLLGIIKSEAPETAVILLTTMGLNCNIEHGYKSGADSYLVKDSSPGVVVANVNAILRYKNFGGGGGGDDVVQNGLFKATVEGHRIEIESKVFECTYKEFKLMYALIKHPNFVFTRNDLLDVVYIEEAPTDRNIDQIVKRIRRKVENMGVLFDPIKTVPTIGYKLGTAKP